VWTVRNLGASAHQGCRVAAGGDSSPPLTRTLLGIDEQAFVLCYFEVPQQKAVYPSGLLPKTFDLWCSILARSPGAVLLIIGVKPGGATAQHIHQEAAVRGLLPSRFVLVDDTYQGHAWEHTAASRASGALVDLFLDNPGVGTPLHGSTFPRLGVPMLTLPSESPCTRTGASMSVLQGRAMAGVASSAKDFEDSASYYASKGGRPKLGQERDKLLGLMKQSSSRSHNVKLWVSDLETAYRRLHRRMVRKRMHG
jgi:predicted O-linked N-acetylglucosamine transferase (SPINDLY family)